MKMTNRFIAFCLGLLLTLHSICLPAYANERIEYREDGIYHYVDDCDQLPSYDLESGIGTTSLGLTLSAAQIAALIAGSVGVVYSVSNWDALAAHLQSALNDAASTISGGTEALLNWWSAAANGDINLSAVTLAGDLWIAQTILNVMHNIHQALSYPQSSPLGQYAPVEMGKLVPAGTPIYVGGFKIDQDTGAVIRQFSYSFDVDTFVFPFVYLDLNRKIIYTDYYIFKQDAGSAGNYTYNGTTAAFNTHYNMKSMTSASTGLTRFYLRVGGSFGVNTYDVPVIQSAFDTYIAPGAIVTDVQPDTVSFSLVRDLFDQYMSGEDVIGANPMPGDVAVLPDVYIGGITDAWTGDIGSDVITLPDISLDGSDLITGDDAASIDTSISTALDKVATGELTWDDLWLDISGAKPEITVKDDAAEDVGPELGLPDWFIDFCDRVTGNPADRNDKIDSLLPGLGDGMASIDDFESDILDQFNNAFNDLDLDGFQLSSGILAALTWLVYWVVQFFNASGDLQVVILLPMFLGLALLFIGRGSMAMQRVEASHLKASLKKDGGGSS